MKNHIKVDGKLLQTNKKYSHVLVKKADFSKAINALRSSGYKIEEMTDREVS